jgi:hypothetical protein
VTVFSRALRNVVQRPQGEAIMQSKLVVLALVLVAGCGGSSGGTTNPLNNNNGNTGTTSGNGKTLTATYNGASYNPTQMTAVYASGTLAINATDGVRALSITGLNINGAGTYSFAAGNPNSGIVQWIDGVGNYSSGYNGSGTVTFTVLQTGRVAGSFNMTIRTLGISGAVQTLALVGTFDIKFP